MSRDSQRLEAAMSLVWPMVNLRAVLVSIVCFLLAGCNDTTGLSITEFRATVDVAADGSAVVSEELTLLVKDDTNYGGVFFDVPLAFVDQAGWRRKRGFELLEAVHQGGDGYYTNRRSWDGRTIYVGHEHCRRCSTDLPRGSNVFRLSYRLDRLLEERDGKQVLNLPAYLSSIIGIDGLKTITFRFPADGKILASGLPLMPTKVIERSPRLFTISVVPNALVSQMASLEVEFTANTFDVSHSLFSLVGWWLQDHLIVVLSGAGVAIVLLYSGVIFHTLWRARVIDPAEFDPGLVDHVSPGLAAFLVFGNSPAEMRQAFKASIYWLAIRGYGQLMEAQDGLEVLPTGKRASRAARFMMAASVRIALRPLVRKNKTKQPLQFGTIMVQMLDLFKSEIVMEYQQNGRRSVVPLQQLLTVVFILFFISTFAGYWGGYLSILLSGWLFCLLLLSVLMMPFQPIAAGFQVSDWKSALCLGIGYPVGMAVFGIYIVEHIPVFGLKIPWLLSYLTVLAAGAWLLILGRPSAKQKNIRRQVLLCRDVLQKKPELLAREMSADTYERFLPMAIALGVDRQWTDHWHACLAVSGGAPYEPAWQGASLKYPQMPN